MSGLNAILLRSSKQVWIVVGKWPPVYHLQSFSIEGSRIGGTPPKSTVQKQALLTTQSGFPGPSRPSSSLKRPKLWEGIESEMSIYVVT